MMKDNHNMVKKNIFFIALLLCQSCCTKVLWSAASPHNVVWIKQGAISEAALKARGVEYRKCEDAVLGSGFVIEKTKAEKFRDYSVVALGTPITLVLDGVTLVVQAVLSADPGQIANIAVQSTINCSVGKALPKSATQP